MSMAIFRIITQLAGIILTILTTKPKRLVVKTTKVKASNR